LTVKVFLGSEWRTRESMKLIHSWVVNLSRWQYEGVHDETSGQTVAVLYRLPGSYVRNGREVFAIKIGLK